MSHSVAAANKPNLAMCILSYLGIFALIPYLACKDDAYIQWHAKQGLLLAAVMIALSVALSILSMVPWVGFVASVASGLLGLGSLALSLYCMIQAYSGKTWRIPVIGAMVK